MNHCLAGCWQELVVLAKTTIVVELAKCPFDYPTPTYYLKALLSFWALDRLEKQASSLLNPLDKGCWPIVTVNPEQL